MRVLVALGLLLLTGCAAPPFPPEPRLAPAPASLAEVEAADWPGEGDWTLRYSARLKIWWKTVPMTLLVKVSPEGRTARVAALDEHMGATLFALTIDGEQVQVVKAMPQLAAYPSLLQRVGVGIGRIYFSGRHLPVSSRTSADRSLILRRAEANGDRLQIYSGRPLRRLEQAHHGQGWRVRYFQFEERLQELTPAGIVYHDDPAAMELILWLEQIRRGP